jgi:hypothetical protein
MRIPRGSTILALALLGGSVAIAQNTEWQQARHGVDRTTAAGKPNEAGALPESTPPAMPDGSQDAATAPQRDVDFADAAVVHEASPRAEARELPRTASPLALLSVSGLMALAAGGGLYRLSRNSQH